MIDAKTYQKAPLLGRGVGVRLVCLDDDPTGIQTVHGCLLLTEWSEESIDTAFRDAVPFFYILTNTRAMTREQAAAVTREAMRNVLKVNQKYNFRLIFVSRSDSCLRGHFPLETDVMHEVIAASVGAGLVSARPYDGSDKSVRLVVEGGHKARPYSKTTFFCPAFLEAGRFTKDGVHYLKDGEKTIPVHETEFARDNVFAYHHSNLRDYIAEKLGHSTFNYGLLSLSDFHNKTEQQQAEIFDMYIREFGGNGKHYQSVPAFIAVDATDYSHLYAFAKVLVDWLRFNERYAVIRSSSSLPKALSGIEDKPLLTKEELIERADTRPAPTGNEGVPLSGVPCPSRPIFIVGSHVKKTTTQLENLLRCEGTVGIEVDVEKILNEPETLWQNLKSQLLKLNSESKTPVIYTSRKEIRLDDPDKRQRLGQTVSDFLVSIVRRLPYRPSCIIAKGGITSHDILTHGLQIKTARVMGQILNAVPCIRTGADATFPHLPYIIFPGNVGTETALAEVYEKLK